MHKRARLCQSDDPNKTIASFVRRGRQDEKLGSGTYGHVFMARDQDKLVAVKRFHTSQEHDLTQLHLNEMSIHSKLSHPNIVHLLEIVPGIDKDKPELYMILECMKHDLRGIIQNGVSLYVSKGQIKCYILQIACGLSYLHEKQIMHLDLKPENVLVSEVGVAKLADFGLSLDMTTFDTKQKKMPLEVVSLWYRSPELLLLSPTYSYSVDIWSLGCIMAELLLMSPLFPGHSPSNQLQLIYQCCGTPCKREWPGVDLLPGWKHFGPTKVQKKDLSQSLAHKKNYFSSGAIDLLKRCLTLNPEKRASAQEIMRHVYLLEETPVALKVEHMPKYPQSYFGKTIFKEGQKV
jgi:serine/threonine protein kinase